MARKRTLRERALEAIGDFAGYATEEMIREKMAALYEKDALESGEDDTSIALHKAVIMRDGNLDAFEAKRKENPSSGWAGEDHAGMKQITKVMDDIRRDVGAAGKKKSKTAGKRNDALPVVEDSPKNGEIIEAPEPLPMPMPEPEPEKRKRGRPHKHKAAGGQFSVWLPDETKKRLQVRAAAEGISAGELAARFIEAGLLK